MIVAEQLPDSNPTKKVSLAFRDVYQKANNAPTTDAFSAYSFDGWLVLLDAAKRALAKAQPGTPEFREAFKRRHADDQGSGRHARRLQLQARTASSASTSALACWCSSSRASGSCCSEPHVAG